MANILKTIAVCAIAVCAMGAPSMAATQNVLFISIDDLKPWLGAYDHPVIKTPNIDRLAASGTVFRNTYCQVALCGPSRMSTLTGLRPDTLRIYNMGGEIFHIDTARQRVPQLQTLPGHFKANGYTSLGFGKVFDSRNTDGGQDSKSWSEPKGVSWQFNTDLYPTPPARGGFQSPDTRKRIEAALAKAQRRGITKKRAITDFLATVEGTRPVGECLDVPDEAYSDANAMAAPAIEAIEKFGESRTPFFLAVGFYKPHLPFIAPKKYWDLYTPEDFKLAPIQAYPIDGVAVAETPYNEGRGFHPIPAKGPIPEDLQRHMLHGYAACVSYVDAQVGKLLKALEEAGLLENTVICLWSDHGFHLGDKQIWGKHSNFEEATLAPLIISSPRIPGGVIERSAQTELVDVFPTLVELTGLPAPAKLDGESLVPLMRGERPSNNPPAASQYMRNTDEGLVMGWAIRTARYRYVEWRKLERIELDYKFSGEVVGRELYDYQTDPGETRNFATSPEYKSILAALVQQFDETLPHLPKRGQQ